MLIQKQNMQQDAILDLYCLSYKYIYVKTCKYLTQYSNVSFFAFCSVVFLFVCFGGMLLHPD